MSQTRYQFTAIMEEWRGDLYIATKDKKIFVRKRTEQGTIGLFINSILEAEEILEIKKEKINDRLEVVYRANGEVYSAFYASDRED